MPVDRVWSGHPVGFALLTDPPRQYVAYYNAERQMVVAMRNLDSTEWVRQPLDEHVGWDSHNSIVMALDDTGRLHVSGNMHVHPLVYFRMREPHDVRTLERVPMVGSDEDRVTYPRFLRGPKEELLFNYRDGKSGSGNEIYNVYDPEEQSWKRLLDKPLVDGEGERNAYFNGPLLGPDGYYHLCWVWRDTPDCATNHDLSYARSRDLVHWESSRGESYTLPITLATAEIVDPVPAGGGIINGNTKIGFDHEDRVVLSYHKFDANGVTQLYNARLEEEGWAIYQSSDWDYRWEFGGGGSIPFDIRVGAIEVDNQGNITQDWWHVKHGNQRWRLSPDTLAPVEQLSASEAKPAVKVAQPADEKSLPELEARSAPDSGRPGEYALRWQTLGPNRDKPRQEPWPEPTMLEVCRLR